MTPFQSSAAHANQSPMPPMDRRLLRGFERLSVPMLESIAGNESLRNGLHHTIGRMNGAVIEWVTGPSWEIHGFEPIQTLRAPQGLIMVSNHRSFFDMFVISTVINRRTSLMQRITFPVRSNFYYTHPLGAALNLAISGASMWPPVFRDDRRRLLNPIGMDQLAATLKTGVAIGLHPEGKRNKGSDPYDFLPAKPGLGQLLSRVHQDTVVLPVFIAGLSNEVLVEFKRNRKPPGQRGEPVRMRFAKPLHARDLQATGLDALGMTEAVFSQVRELAEVDRAERQARPMRH